MSEDVDFEQAVVGLCQQVRAFVSMTGVLLGAVRRGGLIQPDLEAPLLPELVEAAAAQPGQVRGDWELVVLAAWNILPAERH